MQIERRGRPYLFRSIPPWRENFAVEVGQVGLMFLQEPDFVELKVFWGQLPTMQ
jgi:hypothetical protein